MRGSLLVYGWLLVIAVVGPTLVRAKGICGHNEHPFFEQKYSHLFSKLEEALINNTEVMDRLRHGFMSTENFKIYFSVQLEVIDGRNLTTSCDDDDDDYYYYYDAECTFCRSEYTHQWITCYDPDMTLSSQALDKSVLLWLSLLHGSLMSVFFPFFWPLEEIDYDYEDGYYDFTTLTQ